MPNPYLEDELKRTAQVGALKGGTSNTMPIGGAPQVQPVAPKGDASSDFMALAGRFAPNPSGLDSLFGDAAFRERFPNAKIHKNDWVNLGDGSGLIDAIRGFNRDTGTGEAWQWLTEAQAIQDKAASGSAQRPMGINPALDNSALTRIMAEISAASNDDQSPAEREAILQMLQGGVTR